MSGTGRVVVFAAALAAIFVLAFVAGSVLDTGPDADHNARGEAGTQFEMGEDGDH